MCVSVVCVICADCTRDVPRDLLCVCIVRLSRKYNGTT